MPLIQRATTVRELVPLLYVQDINSSMGFYRDHLGFEVAVKWEPDGKLAWCRLQRDDSALMLQQADDEDEPQGRGRGISFYFVCDDAGAIHTEFSQRGLCLDPPKFAFYGMNQVFVKDPDGYELCFESPTDRS
jgi:uncharacterized glyoxalase superfamily protein PhnB